MGNGQEPITPQTKVNPQEIYKGLTKREYFAAKVMQGMCASNLNDQATNEIIASVSVDMADALLKALESE